MELNKKLSDIVTRFDVSVQIESINLLKAGHINSSYYVKNSNPNQCDVLLQKVNQQVFKNVEQLMKNQVLVTNHIRSQDRYRSLVAEIIQAKTGEYWVEIDNEFWRMYEFIESKKTHEFAESSEMCYKAGFTFGNFLQATENIPLDSIYDHIPDFHNILIRLEQLERSLEKAKKERLKKAGSVLNEIEGYRDKMSAFFEEAESGKLPKRILHNDTKLSNVLIGDQILGTVIDLDTVMPGYVFFDIGDALRSIAVNAKEDEADTGSIRLISIYKNAFIEGYLAATSGLLTDKEVQSISFSGAYMAYIMAVRFLTDYLNNDKYYSIAFPEHNLVRAKNQIKVCSLFLRN